MIAVSILFSKEPEKLSFYVAEKKKNVLKIFESKTLEVLPTKDRGTGSVSLLKQNQNVIQRDTITSSSETDNKRKSYCIPN